METQQQEKQEFKRIQNHRAYSAINPTISGDNKNETKEQVGRRGMQRRHSYDINYYKRELDRQAYPPSPPSIIIASSTSASSNINTSSPSSQSPTSFLPPSSSSKQTPHHNFQNFEATLGFSSPVLSPLPTCNNNKNNNGNDDKNEFHLDEEFNNSNDNNDGKDVTENFLFRRKWDDEIGKRKYKK